MPRDDAFAVSRVEIDVPLAVAPERAWDALTRRTSDWWRRDFYTSAETRGFVIEPVVGGRAYEQIGDAGGLLWFRVEGIEPPRRLRLAGTLWPAFGGPSQSLVEIALEARDGGSLLRLSDCLFGANVASARKSIEEGWRLLFAESFRAFVER